MVRDKNLEQAKSDLPARIRELEDELTKTKYNKRTQGHIGLIKAKLAKLKDTQQQRRSSRGKLDGYSVKRSGDASVIMIGFPSVGKSTLLNILTNAKSATAAYAFTTLTCIPGMLEHRGAKIQVLDVPGVLEGAADGTGRGREVLSVAIGSDMVLFVVDVFFPEHYSVLQKEIREAYLRVNEEKPDIRIKKKPRGGIHVGTTVRLTKLDEETIKKILQEFKISNADVLIRSDVDADQFIDAIEGNKKYVKGLTLLNKVDIAPREAVERAVNMVSPDLLISAETGMNIDRLKDLIFERLELMRVFCKRQGKKADLAEPMIMRRGDTVADMCNRLHKDFLKRFKFARIWGSSRFPGQAIRRLDYKLYDNDVVELIID